MVFKEPSGKTRFTYFFRAVHLKKLHEGFFYYKHNFEGNDIVYIANGFLYKIVYLINYLFCL